jgi:hypothetical protein
MPMDTNQFHFPPELDLLEQLCDEPVDLYFASRVYGWPNENSAVNRARNAVMQQLKEGLLRIEFADKTGWRDISLSEFKQRLSADEVWLNPVQAAQFRLRLTSKGARFMFG